MLLLSLTDWYIGTMKEDDTGEIALRFRVEKEEADLSTAALENSQTHVFHCQIDSQTEGP